LRVPAHPCILMTLHLFPLEIDTLPCKGHSDIEPNYGPPALGHVSRWILENRRSVISGSEERALEQGREDIHLIREFGPQMG